MASTSFPLPQTSCQEDVHEEYSTEAHATTFLKFLYHSHKADSDPMCNVIIEIDGEAVTNSHGPLLAACSKFFESTLTCIHPPTSVITLDLDSKIIGVNKTQLRSIIHYIYTGYVTVNDEILLAARLLQFEKLEKFIAASLEKPDDTDPTTTGLAKKENKGDVVPDHLEETIFFNEEHAIDVLREFDRLRRLRILLDCVLNVELGRMWAHRCMLAAFSPVLASLIASVGQRATVVLDIDPKAIFMSNHDAIEIVNFLYIGGLRSTKKDNRLKLLRIPAERLKINVLVDLIERCLVEAEIKDEESDFDEMNSNPDAHQGWTANLRRRFLTPSFDGATSDYQYSCAPTDPNMELVEDYNNIYDSYVIGPKRKPRKRNINQQRTTSAQSIEVLYGLPTNYEDDGPSSDEKKVPKVRVTRTFSNSRRKRKENYGYALPEVVSVADIDVDLIVGDQREMMEKPFKCTYCSHRTKERSSLKKHIRSMHTFEAPYKCHYCDFEFKVQSNLLRHIRSHTGEKPYVCKKCGVAYADKKNMDTHIFREHLHLQPIPCRFPACQARFWRQDRYEAHCKRSHGFVGPPANQFPMQ